MNIQPSRIVLLRGARHGGITEAVRNNPLRHSATRPSAARVAQLEEYLGVTLFHSAVPFALTPSRRKKLFQFIQPFFFFPTLDGPGQRVTGRQRAAKYVSAPQPSSCATPSATNFLPNVRKKFPNLKIALPRGLSGRVGKACCKKGRIGSRRYPLIEKKVKRPGISSQWPCSNSPLVLLVDQKQ